MGVTERDMTVIKSESSFQLLADRVLKCEFILDRISLEQLDLQFWWIFSSNASFAGAFKLQYISTVLRTEFNKFHGNYPKHDPLSVLAIKKVHSVRCIARKLYKSWIKLIIWKSLACKLIFGFWSQLFLSKHSPILHDIMRFMSALPLLHQKCNSAVRCITIHHHHHLNKSGVGSIASEWSRQAWDAHRQ